MSVNSRFRSDDEKCEVEEEKRFMIGFLSADEMILFINPVPVSDNIFAILKKSNIFPLMKIEKNEIKKEEKEYKNENKENQNCELQGGLSAE